METSRRARRSSTGVKCVRAGKQGHLEGEMRRCLGGKKPKIVVREAHFGRLGGKAPSEVVRVVHPKLEGARVETH